MNRVDERAKIPLGVVMTGLVTLIPVTIAGAYKVFTVDARLERIEQKLGISTEVTEVVPRIIEEARGEGRK